MPVSINMSGPIARTASLHQPAGYQYQRTVQGPNPSGSRFEWTAWLTIPITLLTQSTAHGSPQRRRKTPGLRPRMSDLVE